MAYASRTVRPAATKIERPIAPVITTPTLPPKEARQETPRNATCERILSGIPEENFVGMRYWLPEPEKMVSPYGKYGPHKKYVTFEPDNGGFNNVRMAFEAVAVFAHATRRTLVVPPRQRLYLLKEKHAKNKEAFHGIGAFMDLQALGKVVDVIDSREFARSARSSLFESEDVRNLADEVSMTGSKESRKKWREWQRRSATVTPAWDPMREAMIFGNANRTDPPWRLATTPEFASTKRRIRQVDQTLAGAPWIHFAANASFGYRIFTHWYTFFLFADGPLDAYYKRFARDRLRYREHIVCAAGRVVRHLGDTYSAIHVRRGELQYVSVRVTCDALVAAVDAWLKPGETLFVLSDETDHTWFEPLARRYRLFFLYDFEQYLVDLDPNARGMVEQLVAAAPPARTFTGTFFSTFSSFVSRLRRYYGHRSDTFYYAAPKEKQYIMHSDSLAIHYPYFNREWPLAWQAIDEMPPNADRQNPALAELPEDLPVADLERQRVKYPSKQVEQAKQNERKNR